MERLTKRIVLDKGSDEEREVFVLDDDKIKPWQFSDLINKIAEYEEAEEQGLLVRLPCKVGDKTFHVYHGDKAYVVEGTVIAIKHTLGLSGIVTSEFLVGKHFDNGKVFGETLDFSREGETWFKSKIDAENKVKWWNE